MSNTVSNSTNSTLQGATFHCQSDQDRVEAIDKAFDYRGDVTLTLVNGSVLEGYMFNRISKAPHPHIQMFVKGEEKQTIVPYGDIQAVAFTGRDTADGKSWQDWMAKKDSERKAEAEKIKNEVAQMGHI